MTGWRIAIIACAALLLSMGCGGISDEPVSLVVTDKQDTDLQPFPVHFELGTDAEVGILEAHIETDNPQLPRTLIANHLDQFKSEMLALLGQFAPLASSVKIPDEVTIKVFLTARNAAANSEGFILYQPLYLHMEGQPIAIGDDEQAASDVFREMATTKTAIDFNNKYYQQIMTHEYGHLVLYANFHPSILDADWEGLSEVELERAKIAMILYFKYNEFFADLFQVLFRSDHYNFSYYEAFKNGYFPGKILPLGKFSNEDGSPYRNFSADNPGSFGTVNITAGADHTFFSPLAKQMGERFAGKTYSISQKAAILAAAIKAIVDDYNYRIENTHIGSDYEFLGILDGYWVREAEKLIREFADRLFSNLPSDM